MGFSQWAINGETAAVNGIVRIIGQRARLLGLYQAGPTHPEASHQMLVVGPAEGNQDGNR